MSNEATLAGRLTAEELQELAIVYKLRRRAQEEASRIAQHGPDAQYAASLDNAIEGKIQHLQSNSGLGSSLKEGAKEALRSLPQNAFMNLASSGIMTGFQRLLSKQKFSWSRPDLSHNAVSFKPVLNEQPRSLPGKTTTMGGTRVPLSPAFTHGEAYKPSFMGIEYGNTRFRPPQDNQLASAPLLQDPNKRVAQLAPGKNVKSWLPYDLAKNTLWGVSAGALDTAGRTQMTHFGHRSNADWDRVRDFYHRHPEYLGAPDQVAYGVADNDPNQSVAWRTAKGVLRNAPISIGAGVLGAGLTGQAMSPFTRKYMPSAAGASTWQLAKHEVGETMNNPLGAGLQIGLPVLASGIQSYSEAKNPL